MLVGIQNGEMRLTPCMNDVMVIFRALCLVLECESFVKDSDGAHDKMGCLEISTKEAGFTIATCEFKEFVRQLTK